MVGADGEPLIVYHGTDAEFSSFDPDHETVSDEGYMGSGIYFHEESRHASAYADFAAEYNNSENDDFDIDYAKQTIYPVYLRAVRPYNLSTHNDTGSYGMKRDDVIAWTKRIVSRGYDSVTNGRGEWCVFSPTQIKSIYNNGNFDPNTANISEGK